MQGATSRHVDGLLGLVLRGFTAPGARPTPDERLAVAILIKPDAVFDALSGARALARHGLGEGTAAEAEALAETAERCPAYRREGRSLVLVNPGWAQRVATRAVLSATLAVPLPAPRAPRTRTAPTRARTTTSHGAVPTPPPERASKRPAKARTEAASSEGPPLPDGRSPEPLGVHIASPDTEAIVRLFAQHDDLASISLALRAHALSTAEQFHELIGLGSLAGVDSHTYQVETVRKVLRVLRGRALLADEVGLGKTVEALMILREYQLRGMARRALVLAPPALVHHWAGELTEKGGLEVRTTLGPELRKMGDRFWSDDGIVVASLALARGGKHADSVRGAPWDIVIVDEAHHVKNRKSASYELVNGLRSRFLLLLTATPVETDLDDIYNLVTLLKPGQFATPAAFRKQFVDTADPTSPKNRDRLRALLGEVMVRNTRAQSGLKLPPRFVTTVVVEPTEAERELYEAVLALVRRHSGEASARLAATTLLLEAGSSPKAVESTLSRIAQGDGHTSAFRDEAGAILPVARRIETPRKDAAILEILKAVPDQALIFTRYRHAADHLARHLSAAGLGVEMFHGGLGAEDKARAIERFRDGARCLVSTDIGGEGQNLQFCHLLVNYDLPWNPMQIEQRIGRLHRMGQTEPVRVYNLCARATAEERLLDVLDRRLHLFELVVGEMDMVLGNLADERDLEERILALYSASTSEEDLDRGFDAIADELGRARSRYERTRAFDEALFGSDYET